ncbi:hypothetical protein BOX15_Mlig007818g2 [Macrostomum lignano]|uniref:Uncharacterized protein n=2 Tax=Macrostomum lignano TaxID=282301 RepID=A0A267DKN6_9PLAT|nr:hypothetical protein BOX15_Mlig007818g3 [Macrostomum lignano]PAA86449.1 hypothetical protein BOX15_Mlig007818g2 [Macrostomum lignano]
MTAAVGLRDLQLPCLLLLTALSLNANGLQESLLPLAMVCNQREFLHILMPARTASDSSNSNSTASSWQVCLEFYNSYDSHWMRIVLGNTTKTRLVSSHGQPVLRQLVFRVPSEYLKCQYPYRWKVEQLSNHSGSSSATGNCDAETPEQECEIAIGRQKGCSGWRQLQINKLRCRPDLVDPANFTTLRRQLCDKRRKSVSEASNGVRVWLAPVAATLGCLLVAIGAALALYRLLSKRAREFSSTADRSPAEPILPIFSALSDDARLLQALESRICSVPRVHWGLQRPADSPDFLLASPDTGEPILLEEA